MVGITWAMVMVMVFFGVFGIYTEHGDDTDNTDLSISLGLCTDGGICLVDKQHLAEVGRRTSCLCCFDGAIKQEWRERRCTHP